MHARSCDLMHAAPVCTATARCRPRALCSSAMHVPAAACTHNSWQPGGVRGSPSVTPSMRHRAHPRAPREAIHAHRGRRSTRPIGGYPRASRQLIQALQGTRSTRSEGGDPRSPREAIHEPEGGDPCALREVIHALQGI
jgi:hypothetical protein